MRKHRKHRGYDKFHGKDFVSNEEKEKVTEK